MEYYCKLCYNLNSKPALLGRVLVLCFIKCQTLQKWAVVIFGCQVERKWNQFLSMKLKISKVNLIDVIINVQTNAFLSGTSCEPAAYSNTLTVFTLFKFHEAFKYFHIGLTRASNVLLLKRNLLLKLELEHILLLYTDL